MKALKYLIPLWFGVIIYTVFSFTFGARGISAYNQLETESVREQANIDALKRINSDLKETRNSLFYDKDDYSIYARELGFAGAGEQFIRIVGMGNLSKTLRFPGDVVYNIPPLYVSDRIIRILSFFAAITLLISMGVYDLLRAIKSHERP
jgi:cell division protein FtsB